MRLGDASESTKHFWSFTAKQCCSILRNNWSSWGPTWLLTSCLMSSHLKPPTSQTDLKWWFVFFKTLLWAEINNVLSNQFGISELLETWITSYKLHGAILFLQLLQLFRRTMQHCFAVKLQKRFVDYETSLVFSSAWVNNDRIFIFCANCSF